MNKIFMAVLGVMLAGSVMAQGYDIGFGATVTAGTTAAQTIIRDGAVAVPATSVSVFNSGTNVVYASINNSAAEFAAQVAAGRAVPIPASMAYTFTGTRIDHVWIVTGAGSSVVYIGANLQSRRMR